MTVQRQLHKFGGSSLANPECYLRVVGILKEYSTENDLVVVSAAGKTTNRLIEFLEGLNKDGRIAHEALQSDSFKLELIESLLESETKEELLALLHDEFSTLSELTAPLTNAQKAAVLGHGEVWSARLLAALLSQRSIPAVAQDARAFLRAEAGTQPEVDRARSYPLIKEILAQHNHKRVVITGFMAQNEAGETILLGRNGSDYSSTVIGALAEVSTVTIWSDVAGVYSADPRLVSDACLLPLLRLDEASELARLAAPPVLHSRTLQPVAQSTMDLNLKCSYLPESGSTRIERVLASGRGAKIITSLDDVLLVQLSFMHGHDFEKTQSDVLQVLQRAQLEPLAFEAQSDQHTLRLAYTAEIAGGALKHLQELAVEAEIKLKEGYSLLAAVGAGVTKNANHCFGFYQKLKHSPVEFISETDSGLSLVAVLRRTDTEALVQTIHSQLFQAQNAWQWLYVARVILVLVGIYLRRKSELEKRHGMSFDLVAVVDSQTYWFDEQGIEAASVAERFDDESIANNGDCLARLGALKSYDEAVVLDVTASKELAQRYVEIAQQGIHLISANKVAGSADSQYYHQVQDAFAKIGRHWLYNATVGAGLPINHTVRDLRESGDEIVALSGGIFSGGTLSWLFQQFDGSVPFNDLVDLAWQQGLTEPDPRSDLDGSDVMRKLVILARESGLDIEPDSVKVESLVPEELRELSLDDFFDNGALLSEILQERLTKAQRNDQVLRYVARLEKNGKATVGVEALSREHALANLLPCDNIFAIESKWYKDNPLVIRGPGAGREVTAGAIQSDLNRLAGLF
ncbi:LOW QUALITY PROTEIN: aspartokinase [Vibrio sp. JCM 18904]|nr:LOW QUALITY PROTEIN: aspartokinase [Vibrio sp. JCM 18904]